MAANMIREPRFWQHDYGFFRISIATLERALLPCGVPNRRVIMIYWVPVLAWMCVIFSASSDQKSFQHSSRLIAPVIRWLFPHMPEAEVGELVFGVRKLAHFAEYAVLAMLLWRALRKPSNGEARPWVWREAFLALALSALYPASDEFHQRFVPTRQASVWDVLIDTIGAACGLLFLFVIARSVERIKKRASPAKGRS
jgi:VanZ family protein